MAQAKPVFDEKGESGEKRRARRVKRAAAIVFVSRKRGENRHACLSVVTAVSYDRPRERSCPPHGSDSSRSAVDFLTRGTGG